MSGKTKRCANRAAQALSLTAAGEKLARLIYAILTKGEEHADAGQEDLEEHYRQRVLRMLTERARRLGMQIVPVAQPA